MMIKVTLQARQAFQDIVSTDALKESIAEEQEKIRRMREDNATRLAALNTVMMTAMIEITLRQVDLGVSLAHPVGSVSLVSSLKLKSIFLPGKWFKGVSEEVAALAKPLLQKHELGQEKDGGKVGGKKG